MSDEKNSAGREQNGGSNDPLVSTVQMLRLILDSVPQGIFWKDKESRYLGSNQVVANAFGLQSADDIVGLDDHQLPGLTFEQATNFIAFDKVVIQTNSPKLGIVEQARLADGTIIWMETNKFPLHDNMGNIIGVLGTWQDVTARKRSELEARVREDLLQIFIEHSPVALAMFDRDMRYIHASRRWKSDLDLPDCQLAGKSHYELFPDIPARWKEIHRRAKEGEIIQSEEDLYERENGSKQWFRWEVRPWHDDAGGIGGVLIFFEEITARKQAEVDRARLASIVESSEDAILSKAIDGTIVTWNAGAERLFGYAPSEAIGKSITLIVPSDKLEEEKSILRRLANGEQFRNYETVRVTKDGNRLDFSLTISPIRNANGQIVAASTIARDITAREQDLLTRQKLESQIQHAQKLESLGVLAGGIAHDFNNILTSILGYTDLALLEVPLHSPARGLIAEAVNGARKAADLTKQMLAYSGKGQFVVQSLNLNDVIEDMMHLLQVSISKKCVLKLHLMPSLPSIEADAVQIRQILMNLVINASDAIGDRSGVIAVTTGVMHCDRKYLSESYLDENLAEGLYVYLEVADTGCGMPNDMRSRIFDPFFTTKANGRGLGLAAVLGIVRGHRGAIKVYSEISRGTTFKVVFPAVDLPPEFSPSVDASTETWTGNGAVLVVDDEESVRGLLRRMLETMGFTVITANDGREGVATFQRENQSICLVVLDMTMPHLDGPETFRELRRIRSDVKAILTSGYNEQSAISQFSGKGLSGFIQKPLRYEELRSVIRSALDI